jgi:SWI/SNF-related matrix-associated actin-dependent regulator 1 of chromatin subfamily A
LKSITSREAAFFATADPAWNADLKKNGWRWIGSKKSWMTSDPRRVVPFLDACDSTTRDAVVRWSGQRADAVAASVAVDAVIDVPAPEGLTYRPYQKAGIAFMRARKVSLNADVPRLGKTIQTLGVINTYDRPLRVLVISPANAKVNWTREARKWLVHKTTVGYAEGDDCPDVDFLVINFTILDRHVKTLGSRQWDVIVVDEAHFLGNKESKRTQAVSKLDGALHVIFLTGTPIYTRPKQLFPMLTRLDPNGLGSNEWRFLRRYCDAKKDEVTGRWNTDGFSNEEELQFLMRKRFMIRREKHDVVNELPTNRQTILLPKTGLTRLIAQEKSAFGQKFDAMFADLEKDLTDAEFEALKEFDTRTTSDEWEDDGTEPVASVRKKLALAKVDMVVDFVEESLLSEKKVVVFAHHREVVKKLQFALAHHGTAVVLGGLSTAARQKEIDRFRDDPDCRVFIGNIMAAGSAISLAAADCVIFAELSWVPSEIDQAEERVWDPVKGVPISVWRLVLEDSLEARIAYVMERRQDSIDRMMVAKYLKKSSDLSL